MELITFLSEFLSQRRGDAEYAEVFRAAFGRGSQREIHFIAAGTAVMGFNLP